MWLPLLKPRAWSKALNPECCRWITQRLTVQECSRRIVCYIKGKQCDESPYCIIETYCKSKSTYEGFCMFYSAWPMNHQDQYIERYFFIPPDISALVYRWVSRNVSTEMLKMIFFLFMLCLFKKKKKDYWLILLSDSFLTLEYWYQKNFLGFIDLSKCK